MCVELTTPGDTFEKDGDHLLRKPMCDYLLEGFATPGTLADTVATGFLRIGVGSYYWGFIVMNACFS